jgi:hypothetical protein
LVPITPIRFAIPENPSTEVVFHVEEDRVTHLTLEGGGLVVEYVPTG